MGAYTKDTRILFFFLGGAVGREKTAFLPTHPPPPPTSSLRPPTKCSLSLVYGWHQFTNIFGHSVASSGRPLPSLRSWRDCYARGTFLVTVGFRFAPNLLAALPPKNNSTRPRIPQVRKLAISHPEIYIFYKKAVLRQNHSANHRFVAVLCPRTTVIFSCISSLHVPRVDWNGRRIRASPVRAEGGLPVDNQSRRSTTGIHSSLRQKYREKNN